MDILLTFSLESISSLLSFTSTYGLIFLFIGLITLGLRFYQSSKFEFILIALVCSVEIFILFILNPENINSIYFLINLKAMTILILIFKQIHLNKTEPKSSLKTITDSLIVIAASIFICIISANSIINKSFGKLNSENYTNQYVMIKDERLIGSKIFQKARLEIYNKQDDLQVKVIHDSQKESVNDVILKIETLGFNFWGIQNKFLTVEDLK